MLEQVNSLDRNIAYLDKMIAHLQAEATRMVSENKKASMWCLKRIALYEGPRNTSNSTKFALEQQIVMLQGAEMTRDTFLAQELGLGAMKQARKDLSVDEVHDVQSEISEQFAAHHFELLQIQQKRHVKKVADMLEDWTDNIRQVFTDIICRRTADGETKKQEIMQARMQEIMQDKTQEIVAESMVHIDKRRMCIYRRREQHTQALRARSESQPKGVLEATLGHLRELAHTRIWQSPESLNDEASSRLQLFSELGEASQQHATCMRQLRIAASTCLVRASSHDGTSAALQRVPSRAVGELPASMQQLTEQRDTARLDLVSLQAAAKADHVPRMRERLACLSQALRRLDSCTSSDVSNMSADQLRRASRGLADLSAAEREAQRALGLPPLLPAGTMPAHATQHGVEQCPEPEHAVTGVGHALKKVKKATLLSLSLQQAQNVLGRETVQEILHAIRASGRSTEDEEVVVAALEGARRARAHVHRPARALVCGYQSLTRPLPLSCLGRL